MDLEETFKIILDSCFEVHKTLGPGLLENSYKQCLLHELKSKGLKVESEKEQPIFYKGITVKPGYRIDILVEDSIIIELKAVKELNDIYTAQIITYMKLAKIKLGLLINFNKVLLKDGIKRIIL